MTVSPARPRRGESNKTDHFRSGLLSRPQSHRKRRKNKWVPFWKRPNCVWTAIKPLKLECQTVQQTRRFIALSLAESLKFGSICVPPNASQQHSSCGLKYDLASKQHNRQFLYSPLMKAELPAPPVFDRSGHHATVAQIRFAGLFFLCQIFSPACRDLNQS